MNNSPDADGLYLDLVLELITTIEGDLSGLTAEQFLSDRNLSDLTAYRLSTIGQYTNRLSPESKLRHPEITWPAIYRMRNIVAHHYNQVDKTAVWNVTQHSLATLAAVCRQELASLDR